MFWLISNCVVLLRPTCLKFLAWPNPRACRVVSRALPKYTHAVLCCTNTCRTTCCPTCWPSLVWGLLYVCQGLLSKDDCVCYKWYYPRSYEPQWGNMGGPLNVFFFFFPIEVISQIPAMIRKREGTSIVGEINTTESCMLHSGRMNHRNITCKTRKTYFAFLPKKNHKLFDHVSHKYKSSVVFIDA